MESHLLSPRPESMAQASPSTRSPSPDHNVKADPAHAALALGDSCEFVRPLDMLTQAHSWNMFARELSIEGRLS